MNILNILNLWSTFLELEIKITDIKLHMNRNFATRGDDKWILFFQELEGLIGLM